MHHYLHGSIKVARKLQINKTNKRTSKSEPGYYRARFFIAIFLCGIGRFSAITHKKAAQNGLLNGEVKNVQGELQAQKNWRKTPPE